MLLQPIWEWLEAEVFPLSSSAGAHPQFNFYRDEIPGLDIAGAAARRRENLRRRLEQFSTAPRWLAVGEAPGWRGCRFSGVPFTSEALLLDERLGFTSERTSCAKRPYAEASATLFHRALDGCGVEAKNLFTWNCIPLHPHQPGRPCTNRRPSGAETNAAIPLLIDLLRLAQPQVVIAVGNCARLALHKAGVSAIRVRHPSHGGANIFSRQMKAALVERGDAL